VPPKRNTRWKKLCGKATCGLGEKCDRVEVAHGNGLVGAPALISKGRQWVFELEDDLILFVAREPGEPGECKLSVEEEWFHEDDASNASRKQISDARSVFAGSED
jgi:hypothetical protein